MKAKLPHILALSVALPVMAAEGNPSPEARFHEGAAAYRSGDYAAAEAAWRDVLADGAVDGHVSYDLGDALYRQGENGAAILAWRRAELLLPRDPDVRANLEMARARVRDAVEPQSHVPALLFWQHSLSLQESANLGSLLAGLALGLWAWLRWRRRTRGGSASGYGSFGHGHRFGHPACTTTTASLCLRGGMPSPAPLTLPLPRALLARGALGRAPGINCWFKATFLATGRVLGHGRSFGPLAVLSGLLGALLLASTALTARALATAPAAVVLAPEVVGRSAVGADGVELFVLHEGAEVRAVERDLDHVLVSLPDGRRGWLPTASLGLVLEEPGFPE